MKTYQVINSTSGHNFGLYRGETPEQAIQAMLDDANHDGPADDDIEAVEATVSVRFEISHKNLACPDGGADVEIHDEYPEPSDYAGHYNVRLENVVIRTFDR